MSESKLSELPDFDGRDTLAQKYQDDTVKALSAFRSLESKMGSETRVPGSNATPEDWAKFHKKMGVPDDPSEYSVPETKDPALVEYLNGLRQYAKDAGVPKATYEKLAAAAAEMGNARAEEEQAKRTEVMAEFRSTLGDGAEAKVAQALEMYGKLSGNEGDEILLAQTPGLTEALLKVSEIVSEDQITGGLGGPSTPEDPKKLADRGKALILSAEFNDKRNPNRAELQAEYVGIVQQLEAAGFEGIHDPRLQPADPFAQFLGRD